MDEFDLVAENMSTSIDGFLEATINRTNSALVLQQKSISSVNTSVIVGFLIILFSGFSVYFLMANGFKQLPFVINDLKKISSGDLTPVPREPRYDEIGELQQGGIILF